jgi:arylsulfatase
MPQNSPGKFAGMDQGWVFSLLQPVIAEFDKSINQFPNKRRFPGGASNDQIPNLQHPENPTPLMDFNSGKKAALGIGMED